MSTQPQRQYTVEDYFLVEESSPIRHEFYNGEIFAMAGGTVAHSQVCSNVLSFLSVALERTPCRALGSDMRLLTPRGLYTYPDVMVICGQVKLVAGREDTVKNPVLLVEVLSDATRNYDRGEKFDLYKEIATFREYLLIEPKVVHVEQLRCRAGGRWAPSVHDRLEQTLTLSSLSIELPVREIYRRVLADS